MDIICPVCAEPWDNDTIHEVAEESEKTYQQVYKTFRSQGCGVAFAGFYDGGHCKPDENSETRLVLADALGGDSDGYAAMMEDFGL